MKVKPAKTANRITKVLKSLALGPSDHGRAFSLDDFMIASYEDGFQYELISGELYVSPQADAPEEYVDDWIGSKLFLYSLLHPEIINRVSAKARVFVPGQRKVTIPEPDRTCYRDYPKHLPLRQIRWQDLLPILVVEVVSRNDPEKDLVRNVTLYKKVPSIQEYWIFDTRDDPERPTMLVYRRRGKRWEKLRLGYGDTYTTPTLPGFALIIDPRT